MGSGELTLSLPGLVTQSLVLRLQFSDLLLETVGLGAGFISYPKLVLVRVKISLEFVVSLLEGLDPSLSILPRVLELFLEVRSFELLPLVLGSSLNQVLRNFAVFQLIALKVPEVVLESLVYFDLNKFLQTLILLHL